MPRSKKAPRWLRMELGNLETATILIEDPALTPGPDSLMYQWAILFLSRRNEREAIETRSGVRLRAMGLTRDRGERPLSDYIDTM